MSEPSPKRVRRVGHKGAAHIEHGNTLASFDAALRHSVDMIELDVLSENRDGSGRLLVARSGADALKEYAKVSFKTMEKVLAP